MVEVFANEKQLTRAVELMAAYGWIPGRNPSYYIGAPEVSGLVSVRFQTSSTGYTTFYMNRDAEVVHQVGLQVRL